jgi:hypothetical protein
MLNAAEAAFILLAFALAVLPILGRAIHHSRKK